MISILKNLAGILCVLLFAATLAWGQAGTGSVRGEVTDPQSKQVGGATVTIKSEATGFLRTQVTGPGGDFSFELMPAGDYVMTVEAPGFKKSVKNVTAVVGSATDGSVRLEIGAIDQTVQVEVAGSAIAINTQDATLGNNFENRQITELPMEARDIRSLLTLQPGVTYNVDPNSTTGGSVNGARPDQSNLTLDGVDINEAQTSRLNEPVLRLNSEAVEEFRVTTLNANANQGRSSAAQVNLITKSGSNRLHGAAFLFNRSTGFTSNSFFNNRTIDPKTGKTLPTPALIRNTFGGGVGGPIIKDKLFFFYSYEGRRDSSAGSAVRVVPLPSMGLGQLRVQAQHCAATCDPIQLVTLTSTELARNVFPSVGLNPAALAILADAARKYPANDFTVGDSTPGTLLNTAGFRFNYPVQRKLNSSVLKLDTTLTSKQTAFFRFNYIVDHEIAPNDTLAPQFPDTISPSVWSHPWGAMASHTWTISNNWVNNFRYGLTRQGFSQIGDNTHNQVSFRFVFEPTTNNPAVFTLSRTTPVHNIIDDVSWVKNKHTIQFGTNLRLVSNNRVSFANAFDFAQTNPSGYQSGGDVVSTPVADYLNSSKGLNVLISTAEAQNAGTSLIGRFSQYTVNLTYDHSGKLLTAGSPSDRTFATQAYDFYVQDTWKLTRSLTLSFGVRYGLTQPVYETHGFEVKPNISLSDYFQLRVASAASGVPFNVPITMQLSGPKNGQSNMYPRDFKNFQPRVAGAWSPSFENRALKAVFGGAGKSVIRAGFSVFSDYFGEALATFFDLNNALGFSSSARIPVNTFNVTNNPAPLFTGFTQDIRSLPRLTFSNSITFPQLQPSDMGERIEASLDSKLQTPKAYTFSLTVERQLPAGLVFQGSYVGRLGRHLLAQRDAMALNDLVDTKSGMDWYTAATVLEKIRATRPAGGTAVTPIPYFENIFPANLATQMTNFYVARNVCASASNCIPATFTPTQAIFWIARNIYGNDWTDLQADVDLARFQNNQSTLFFNPQYGALTAWSTIGNSNYHGLALSVRQHFRNVRWDFNYTFAHSLDDASGLQSSTGYSTASFILNPIRQRDWYASSSFDIRHIINANAIYEFPFGRGRWIGGNAGRGLDALIGGWQLSGIFRWNTGLPLNAPFDDARWATNWNVQSRTVLTRPLQPCITKGEDGRAPKFFGCNTKEAYQSFRNAYPGEGGQRNIFRLPGYIDLDTGLSKSFTMPWSENHKLQLRWEVFNVTNTQHFGAMDLSRSGFGIRSDPAVRNLNPPSNWSNFTDIQGGSEFGRRVMQVGLRYSF